MGCRPRDYVSSYRRVLMVQQRSVGFALSAAMLLVVAACSDSTNAGTGTVGVRLSNASVAASVANAVAAVEGEAPLPEGSVKSVDLFIVRVDAKRQAPTDAEVVENTEESDAENNGWVTVAEPNALFDLLTLADDANTLLGDAVVAAGSYKGFRLIIDPAQSSLTLTDDTVIGGESITGLKFPSAAKTGIKINLSGGPLQVEDGETSTLVVQFDVSRSFVMLGSTIDQNGLLFKPVVHGTQQD
jgi:hypothetical protein